jgi:hypothetical protein
MIAVIQGMDAIGGEVIIDTERTGLAPGEIPIQVFRGVGQTVFSPLYQP